MCVSPHGWKMHKDWETCSSKFNRTQNYCRSLWVRKWTLREVDFVASSFCVCVDSCLSRVLTTYTHPVFIPIDQKHALSIVEIFVPSKFESWFPASVKVGWVYQLFIPMLCFLREGMERGHHPVASERSEPPSDCNCSISREKFTLHLFWRTNYGLVDQGR